MKSLSDAANTVTSKNFSRKFVSIGRIVKSWPEIMGSAFADKATPLRIMYRKPVNRRAKPAAILEIATSQADATLMHYQKDVILQRIAHLFGDNWVTDIKFIAKTRNQFVKQKKMPPRPLTSAEKNHLSKSLDSVSDPLVHERLMRLGETMFRKK